MSSLHLAFAGGSIRARVDGHFLAFDPAVCIPDLRVAEQQHGLRPGIVVCIICARLAVAVPVLEIPRLPDLTKCLRSGIEDGIQPVSLALLGSASGRGGGRWAEEHLCGSKSTQGLNPAARIKGHQELPGGNYLFTGFRVRWSDGQSSRANRFRVFQAMRVGAEIELHYFRHQHLLLRTLALCSLVLGI